MKKFKKIAALMLAVVTIFALSVPVFAAPKKITGVIDKSDLTISTDGWYTEIPEKPVFKSPIRIKRPGNPIPVDPPITVRK